MSRTMTRRSLLAVILFAFPAVATWLPDAVLGLR
jgi:hypothetical protein